MSDSEDDTTFDTNTLYKPSFVLIAIDTAPSMFVKNEDSGTTPFGDCMKACYNLANSLIFTQNKRSWSPFGVVLAHEDASASFVNFDEKILNTIKFLKGKTELSDDKLMDLYQRKGSLDLSAFFLFCKKKFKEVNSVFYKRTIIYITNDDNPVRDSNQRFAALNEAKNFDSNNINFEMVTMNHDFDYKVFYNELYSVLKVPSVETIVEDQEGLLEKLSSLILVRFRQRKLNFFPFLNDNSKFLRVVQKSIIQEETLYNNAFVSTNGKPLKKIPRNIVGALKKYRLKFTTQSLEFEAEENHEIKNNDLPVGYTMLFISDRVTDVGCVFSNTTILESDWKEDLKFFDSFWQYCVDKNKVIICVRKLKRLDKIRFVEFIPKFANNNKHFIIKTIPFIEENNYPPTKLQIEEDTPNPEYSPEKIRIMNELIEKLSFKYDPKMFTNPVSAKKKAFLRSKFLDEPEEDVEDTTLDLDGIDKILGEVGDNFKNLFNLDDEPKKRKAPAAKSVRGKKKK